MDKTLSESERVTGLLVEHKHDLDEINTQNCLSDEVEQRLAWESANSKLHPSIQSSVNELGDLFVKQPSESRHKCSSGRTGHAASE